MLIRFPRRPASRLTRQEMPSSNGGRLRTNGARFACGEPTTKSALTGDHVDEDGHYSVTQERLAWTAPQVAASHARLPQCAASSPSSRLAACGPVRGGADVRWADADTDGALPSRLDRYRLAAMSQDSDCTSVTWVGSSVADDRNGDARRATCQVVHGAAGGGQGRNPRHLDAPLHPETDRSQELTPGILGQGHRGQARTKYRRDPKCKRLT